MKNFKLYSAYYNTLYKDKDYDSEVNFVTSLLANYAPGAKTILELGCGTGNTLKYLQKTGILFTVSI